MSIPKRIFFFWGNQTMSWCRFLTLWSFRKLHPEWEMIVYVSDCKVRKKQWTQHNQQDYFVWEGKDYFECLKELNITFEPWDVASNELVPGFQREKALSPPHKSDLLQWYKLHTEGGVYSDMDILYVKPIDEFWNALNENSVTGCIGCHEGTITIGWMASAPANQLFGDIFQVAIRQYNPLQYQSTGALSVYNLFKAKAKGVKGFLPLSKIQAKYPDENLTALPLKTFYHFHNAVPKIWQANVKLPEEVLGIHWYGGHPLSQAWNKLLDADTWEKHTNTFTTAVKTLLEGDK